DVTYQGLIEAIEEATTDITIKLQDDVSYNILETITLDKPGITITIDGNGQTINGMQKQVFHINSGSSLVLNNITITNGQADMGGAIYNEGTLTIINSTLSNNNATLGGAIENSHGNLTITGSTLENNIATSTVEDTFEAYARGGAISNLYGNVTITNTTINNNQATATGGDVTANAYAGAISNLYGNVTITDSTINNNKATATATGNWDVTVNAFGGVIYNTGTLIVTDSTLENNQATATATSTVDYITVKAHALGGAIYNTDTLTITESTIENNQATTTVSATGYDVTVDANTSGGVIYNYEDNYNITDTIFYKNSPANFIINETTKNIQLVNNDNYISIVNFIIIADGKEIGNGTCVENLTQFTILDEYKNVEIVINGTDEKTLNNRYMLRGYSTEVHNYTQLVKAIEKAQCENYDSYIINLLEGDYNATSNITWSNSATGNITINGNGLTLDGLDKYQFITIAAGHNLTIENITITNYTAIRGGAIQNNGTLTVDNTRFVNNHATDGGAICNVFGNLTVTNTLFADNHAGHRSGAIHNLGTLTITGTQFAGNNATSDGGAIYNIGNLTINNTTFTDNNANTSGGAINIGDGNLNVTGSIFQNNLGIIDGGAILIQDIDCTAVIEENTFIDNRANRYEVINVERGSPILENNTYSDTSECYGTITISTDGEVMIRNNVFYD
ncbi:MAG: hypothetical protein IKF79_05165, partial [Methanosphaera sp.]|nr:hypothetical protein [Methanosphaera sp.]